MREIGSRQRNQPAPPGVIFDDLSVPRDQSPRAWLRLLDDETLPSILDSARPDYVVWSSIWSRRPDARIRFDLSAAGAGTDLRWTLYVDEPMPDSALVGHLRKRLNELINADLRLSYGN